METVKVQIGKPTLSIYAIVEAKVLAVKDFPETEFKNVHLVWDGHSLITCRKFNEDETPGDPEATMFTLTYVNYLDMRGYGLSITTILNTVGFDPSDVPEGVLEEVLPPFEKEQSDELSDLEAPDEGDAAIEP